MLIKKLGDCEEFSAGDGCRLRELLNPKKEDLSMRYSLAHAIVAPGQKTAKHRLIEASEVYVIVAGEGMMFIDDEQKEVRAGDTIYIPPAAVQCIENTGSADLIFFCLVDPAWHPECEEIL